MKIMKLLDVCDFRGGTQPPKEVWISEKQDGYVRMLQIRDFTQGDEKFIQYVPDSKKLRKCEKDDLLLSRYGYIGQVVTGLEGAYNVALVKIERKTDIDRLYLMYYFQSEYFKNYLLTNTGARATIAGFNKSELKDALIPVPDRKTQQEIYEQRKLYSIGRYQSSIIKGIKSALSCKGISQDTMATPFEAFREPERKRVETLLSANQLQNRENADEKSP
jgi:type I restriction enzyme S subunit